MFKSLVLLALVFALFVGCASVPMEGVERTAAAQKFQTLHQEEVLGCTSIVLVVLAGL